MTSEQLAPALRTLKQQLPLLVAHAEDPHAEALALVWGPRFDREHARTLARRAALTTPQWEQAARAFDALPGAVQQHWRAVILRHLRRWENAVTLH